MQMQMRWIGCYRTCCCLIFCEVFWTYVPKVRYYGMYSLSTPLKSQERLQAQRPQSWRFLGWTHHTSSAPPPTILGFDVLVWLLLAALFEHHRMLDVSWLAFRLAWF